MEQDHSEEFSSNLKKMNDEPASFIIDYYEKRSGNKVPKEILNFITGGDVEILAMKLKMHFNRPRPFQIAAYYDVKLDYTKLSNMAQQVPPLTLVVILCQLILPLEFWVTCIQFTKTNYKEEL